MCNVQAITLIPFVPEEVHPASLVNIDSERLKGQVHFRLAVDFCQVMIVF